MTVLVDLATVLVVTFQLRMMVLIDLATVLVVTFQLQMTTLVDLATGSNIPTLNDSTG